MHFNSIDFAIFLPLASPLSIERATHLLPQFTKEVVSFCGIILIG
jgi:hypothetical protein